MNPEPTSYAKHTHAVVLNSRNYYSAVRIGSSAWKARESDGMGFNNLQDARDYANKCNSDRQN